MSASYALPRVSARRRGLSLELLLIFFVFGLLETIASYYFFSRADDHAYFLEIANLGLQAIPEFNQPYFDFKAQASGLVFYILTGPGRLLGGDELSHLLWLRLLTLAGFLAGFVWFQNITNPATNSPTRQANLKSFVILVLVYPGQLAWTASLLRDGAATAVFFLGLACCRRGPRVLLALPLFAAALLLRPEYSVILMLIAGGLMLRQQISRIRWRKTLVVLALLAFSMATHTIQAESGGFAQFAFGDDGMAYPLVTGVVDLLGYGAVLVQAIMDPIPLTQPFSGSIFSVAELVFFVFLIYQSARLLESPNMDAVALICAMLFGLWIFAYFELYVSGFSRHRLCLQIALIALVSTNQRRKFPVKKHAI